ncbi:hypothetical protein FQN53_005916 [Emmonsiellopsis sp. PD_33]|nr:hypothetical protein FQN53_005916 [Emmonsiellopsis sp. PD_33]
MGSTTQDVPIPTYVLEEIVKTDILTPISADIVTHVLSTPPFVSVPGLFNFRDISNPLITPPLKKNHIFRSGMLVMLKDEGKTKLASELGVETIFDLRFERELIKFPSPEIEGVEIRWLALEDNRKPDEGGEKEVVEDEVAFMVNMYRESLVSQGPIYRAVFEHVRDFPEKPFLFHCTAGKDRTGMLAALILNLVGCPTDLIAKDYTLTRVGIEPVREVLTKDLLGSNDPNSEVVLKKLTAVGSVFYGTMVAFVEFLEREFDGGAEGYLRSKLGFSAEDVEHIRANLRE